MSIWIHSDISPYSSNALLSRARCLFCEGTLRRLDFERELDESELDGLPAGSEDARIGVCPRCGWWLGSGSRHWLWDEEEEEEEVETLVACGALKTFDPVELDTPLIEIRDFLAAKYDARHNIHPRKFEDVVASVFQDLGYQARVTAYTGDGGIDVVLDGPNDTVIGVQVKRSKNSIEAEQIRAFVGALVLGGYTRGIYVATSRYRAGATKAAHLAAAHGKPVELVDAEGFYEALSLAQSKIERIDETWFRENIKYFRIDHTVGYRKGQWVNPSPT